MLMGPQHRAETWHFSLGLLLSALFYDVDDYGGANDAVDGVPVDP